MLYQCKVPTLCELRSNHIVQIVFLSIPVRRSGDTSSPACDITIKCRDWHYLESLVTIFFSFSHLVGPVRVS